MSKAGRLYQKPTGLDDQIPTVFSRVAQPRALEASLRSPRIRRWARRHLDALEERTLHVVESADCARWHSGPCDYWGRCSGMNVGYAERQAAGAAHPWRVGA